MNQLESEIGDLRDMQEEEIYRKKCMNIMLHQAEESKKKNSLENEDIKNHSISMHHEKGSNYMSLNYLDQKKEEHKARMEEIEKFIAERKKINDYEMSAYSKLTDDYLLANINDSPKSKKRKDSSILGGRKSEKRTFSKTLSQSINKSKTSSTGYDVLNVEEEEFVKSYKDYLAKTRYLHENRKDHLSDDDREWDHRGIKSQNYRVVKGNLRREKTESEYSYYSISIDGSSQEKISVDISFDKEMVKKKKRQPPQKIKRETKKQFSPFPELNSKLGFFRMIFTVLDKVMVIILFNIRIKTILSRRIWFDMG